MLQDTLTLVYFGLVQRIQQQKEPGHGKKRETVSHTQTGKMGSQTMLVILIRIPEKKSSASTVTKTVKLTESLSNNHSTVKAKTQKSTAGTPLMNIFFQVCCCTMITIN